MNILEQILKEIEGRAEMVRNIPTSEDEECEFPDGEQCYEDGRLQRRYQELQWGAEIIRSHIEDDGWIPVAGKNFPPHLEDKLVQTDSENMYVGWYNENLEEFETEEFTFGGDYGKVIVWQPLPEPYCLKEGFLE